MRTSVDRLRRLAVTAHAGGPDNQDLAACRAGGDRERDADQSVVHADLVRDPLALSLILTTCGLNKVFDGVPITKRKAYRRACAGVSRSFQSLELFEGDTAEQNLRIALTVGRRFSYLADVLKPKVAELSDGAIVAIRALSLEPYMDVRVADLPYGRRRLVAVARTLAAQPSIILLDEPASGLSGAEPKELAEFVRLLADEWGFGVLVVEHNMSFVFGVCDEVTVLNFGEQIASGTPSEVRADAGVIAAYLGEVGESVSETGVIKTQS
jgi:ABC-type branched-subunit amino acid transport system ATPase component